MDDQWVHGDRKIAGLFIGVLAIAIVAVLASDYLYWGTSPGDVTGPATRGKIVILVTTVLEAVFAAYFGRVGWRTLRARVWPPGAMRVPWTVRRQSGWRSVFIGSTCLMVSLMFLIQIARSIPSLSIIYQ